MTIGVFAVRKPGPGATLPAGTGVPRNRLITITAAPLFGTTVTRPGSADVVIGATPEAPKNPAAVDLRINGVCLPPAAFGVDALGNITAHTLTGGFPSIQTTTTVTATYDS